MCIGKNTFVLAFLDCCREFVEDEKKEILPANQSNVIDTTIQFKAGQNAVDAAIFYGQCHILFAKWPGGLAEVYSKHDLSEFTRNFVTGGFSQPEQMMIYP